jgi:hypothetical protein
LVHSVLIIRESEEQLTGSDCCGLLKGDFSKENGKPVFNYIHDKNNLINDLGNFLNSKNNSQLEIKYIDPRNQVYLIPKLLKDVFNYKPPILKALKTLFQFFRCPALIINGIVVDYTTFSSVFEIEKYIKD